MTIRHLRIFVQVYQTLSITKAARELHMTQPTVTRAIQEIERYYNIALFERMNHRLYVTEGGKLFYTHALHIVDSFEQMEKGMRGWNEEGMLRVGSSITLGSQFMPRVVAIMKERYPKLQIHVSVSNAAQIRSDLLENKLDIALIEGDFTQPPLHAEEFSEDRLVLVMSPVNPLCKKKNLYLQDFSKEDFLLRENGSVGRALLNHVFAVHGLQLEPVWESASTRAVVEAVKNNLGISFLPQHLVAASIEAGDIVTQQVKDEDFVRKNYIVWHENKYITSTAREFINLCHELGKDYLTNEAC